MASPSERPRKAYRIGTLHSPLFDGTGAAIAGGRWNSPGRFVIYGAEHYSLALLEQLAHIGHVGRIPQDHVYVEIDIPADASVEQVDPAAVPGWRDPDMAASRDFGDAWCREARSLVLLVPSVVAPMEHNVVINQRHAEFPRLTTSSANPVRWGRPLFAPPGLPELR